MKMMILYRKPRCASSLRITLQNGRFLATIATPNANEGTPSFVAATAGVRATAAAPSSNKRSMCTAAMASTGLSGHPRSFQLNHSLWSGFGRSQTIVLGGTDKKCFAMMSTKSDDKGSTDEATESNDETSTTEISGDNNGNDPSSLLLYESPLSSVVTRLRFVSVLSAVTGSVGLPLFVALRGEMPPTGLLAFGMTFCAGSLASTAAIYFVFSPYVYTIEQIPVRQCHYKKKKESSGSVEEQSKNETQKQDIAPHTTSKSNSRDCLFKAVSRSLFLTRVETVFDPATDVVPYKGLRPLCNFCVVKADSTTPLYVHPEYVYNAALRQALQLPQLKPLQQNPDDELF